MVSCKLPENMIEAIDGIGKRMGISREDALKRSVALLKIIDDIATEEDDYKLSIETKSGKNYKIDLK